MYLSSYTIQFSPNDGLLVNGELMRMRLKAAEQPLVSFKKSTHSLFGSIRSAISTRHSQFLRTLNHTYTAMAARLLRVNILAPSTGRFSVSTPDLD
jgi:hypothetical protein